VMLGHQKADTKDNVAGFAGGSQGDAVNGTRQSIWMPILTSYRSFGWY